MNALYEYNEYHYKLIRSMRVHMTGCKISKELTACHREVVVAATR